MTPKQLRDSANGPWEGELGEAGTMTGSSPGAEYETAKPTFTCAECFQHWELWTMQGGDKHWVRKNIVPMCHRCYTAPPSANPVSTDVVRQNSVIQSTQRET